MTRPGTLYWRDRRRRNYCDDDKHIEMLVETWKLSEEEKSDWDTGDEYGHRLLTVEGKFFTIATTTKRIEGDWFWKERYERIEL